MNSTFSLAQKQKALEFWGFNLYWDDENNQWECMSEEDDYSVISQNKEDIIHAAFYHLISQ